MTDSHEAPPPSAARNCSMEHSHESTPLLPTTAFRAVHESISSRIAHEGESGRSGFHLRHFLNVLWRSSCTASMLVNVLWPIVLVAIVLQLFPGLHLWKFATAYVAVVPSANLLGFAGQEFARKMPKVAGILIETTFGSIVEIILFIVLISQHDSSSSVENGDDGNLIPIIQAAILGSILTNLLLCLGLCFFAGGIRHASQKFHAIVSEVGTGLLLVAAFGLLIPSAFYSALKSETMPEFPGLLVMREKFTHGTLQADVLQISRATSIALIIAFLLYIWYQASSQHSIFDEVIEADEHHDVDREADMQKPKFTMTETAIALAISLVLVTLLLIFLVQGIEHVVHSGIPDQFLGLILLPLVEKAAEHLTAVDEAWDGVINVALYHCLAPSIQTALFNGPLVVLAGWALGKPMDLNFEIFMIVLLVLSIIVVGNFLRDGESNWLEGALLVVVYAIIAIACWYYPNPDVATSNGLAVSEVVNVTMTVDTLRQLQQLLSANLAH
ncbi:calcium/proton exchanger [Colletotrichum graminicola]|uniref:Calcium/proton exchanger n=1 Tax=Colletotrichum graminicola (strain M1.001 / M2 / FGSC 10212) TaxID=645133 RepID=E3QMB0_COLGM|nr:calcium/proton exchanger [Colletotrichum graminicola M1.001]EFQ31998.1 calcium/proton exchanger [Colletotrichum graminicola M1.001]WDK21894.1 calcium/proton exchanger [Colletotrichum graminicola]